jgi:hypothetical protein
MCSGGENHHHCIPQWSKLAPSSFPHSLLQGAWQVVLIVSPQRSMSCILISFKRIGFSTSSNDPYQFVSFVTCKTNLLYILEYMHTHCNGSVIDCFSLVTHVHLVSSNLEIQNFKHLTWPIVRANLNITMLHFLLFRNVRCYTNSILRHASMLRLQNFVISCALWLPHVCKFYKHAATCL